MIRKCFFFILLFAGSIKPVLAVSSSDYVINNFNSAIAIEKDTSITVKETIEVTFFVAKHGIYRLIPYRYSNNQNTITSRLSINQVTLNGQPVNYEVSDYNDSKQIKIGDANLTISGKNKYVISYRATNVLQRYSENDELYWNVTGHEWDTTIEEATVVITSPFAGVTKSDCYAGLFGSKEKYCQILIDQSIISANTTNTIDPGDDFTIVVGLDKNNQLGFPGPIALLIKKVLFILSLIIPFGPILFALYSWYSKGRDQRYLSDNLYINQPGQPTRDVGIFERKYLPLAYQPIKGLSPSQAGTIIDEKVDIQDVVSEIIELARLKFLKIERQVSKQFIGNKTDYIFTKLKPSNDKLHNFQAYLLDKLFEDGDQTKLSDLKNKFYTHLQSYKTKLYENMKEANYFNGNPNKVKGIWFLKFFLVGIGCLFLTFLLCSTTGNMTSLALLPVTIPLNLITITVICLKMPRRTALGYSYYRQLEGLRYFITKGKWREEIAEKNLFLEEILPLAICLGVVTKLAKDMKDLALQPPDYLTGFTAATFARDFSNFSSTTANAMTSTPGSHSTGSSSWSGGSGFSGGGSSGGGFGGGGGGSW